MEHRIGACRSCRTIVSKMDQHRFNPTAAFLPLTNTMPHGFVHDPGVRPRLPQLARKDVTGRLRRLSRAPTAIAPGSPASERCPS